MHHAAPTFGAHRGHERLRQEKRGGHVEVHGDVPALGRNIVGGFACVDTGGVDHDIGRPKRSAGTGCDIRQCIAIGQVGGKGRGRCPNFLCPRFKRIGAPRYGHNPRACIGQRTRGLLPQPGAGSGDTSHPARQVKKARRIEHQPSALRSKFSPGKYFASRTSAARA